MLKESRQEAGFIRTHTKRRLLEPDLHVTKSSATYSPTLVCLCCCCYCRRSAPTTNGAKSLVDDDDERREMRAESAAGEKH